MKLFSMINRLFIPLFLLLALVFLNGCTTVLVSPSDEKLVTDTEAFYKKAAGMIEDGRSVSPLKDDDRANIANLTDHKGHFTKFESKYNELIIDTEALILRAMASDGKIDSTGHALQSKISEMIENAIPSKCQELSVGFSKTSLTAKNYVDLKCIVLKWKGQHSDMKLTKNTQILKKANWEGRKLTVFNAVLAIQKAEGFKQQKTKLEGIE
ncbi:MAG: hypothetical protein KAT04_11940 [Methylococcales bacterium]|nr:hypothetical protein [Methylococcales bacterium]